MKILHSTKVIDDFKKTRFYSFFIGIMKFEGKSYLLFVDEVLPFTLSKGI